MDRPQAYHTYLTGAVQPVADKPPDPGREGPAAEGLDRLLDEIDQEGREALDRQDREDEARGRRRRKAPGFRLTDREEGQG